MSVKVRIERKWADLWIGVYWRHQRVSRSLVSPYEHQLHVWVCLVPCVPLHVMVTWREG